MYNKLSTYILISIVILCGYLFFGVFTTVQAQLVDAQSIPRMTAGEVSVEFNPQYPDAFSEVTVKLVTFSIDLDVHFITWYENNERVSAGYGRDTYQTTTGDYGETTSIRAEISLQDGNTVTKNISVRPNVTDLLWEAVDAYVPPFYKGKAIPTRGSVIKFSALPYSVNQNRSMRPTQFSYTWDWEYKTIGEKSGYAKDWFMIETGILRSRETVSVTARSTDGSYEARTGVRVDLEEPELLLFDESTIPRRQVTGSYVTSNNELLLKAEPYFFGTGNFSRIPRDLNFSWEFDGDIVTPPESAPYRLPITISQSGRVEPKITVRHPDFFSTEAIKNFAITVTE